MVRLRVLIVVMAVTVRVAVVVTMRALVVVTVRVLRGTD